MLACSRRPGLVRAVAALVLALLATSRGVAAALACDVVTPSVTQGTPSNHAMPGMAMPETNDGVPANHTDGPDGKGGCDIPQRMVECWLMVACAPALSVPMTNPATRPAADASLIGFRSRVPAPVDRAPEPPPPRG